MSDHNSIRINKYLSERGPYSRRGIDKLINERRILVNGKLIKPGFKVNTDDEIKIDGEIIIKSKKRKKNTYLIFNKPVGVECTTNQKIKNNIIDYIGYPQRIFPIGRLDKDSEGLIFLTNLENFSVVFVINFLHFPITKLPKHPPNSLRHLQDNPQAFPEKVAE